jgi:pimeloyl-ACP methyl ester carboxylesterase
MTSFPVPGAELAVELSDEGGHPVVQLHGLTSSRQRDRLLNLDLGVGLSGTRLLRYDARGHGRSTGRPVPDDYRWPALAEDLLRLLDAWFPGEKVHGVGPSMGCATLLHAAMRDPERFDGLTLMLPPTAWATRAAKSDEYLGAAALVEKRGLDAFVAAGAGYPPVPAQRGVPETLPDVSPEVFPSLFRGAAMSDLPTLEAIATIQASVTILAWTEDPGHPLSTARALAGVLPHATLHIASTPEDVASWPAILMADVRAHGL